MKAETVAVNDRILRRFSALCCARQPSDNAVVNNAGAWAVDRRKNVDMRHSTQVGLRDPSKLQSDARDGAAGTGAPARFLIAPTIPTERKARYEPQSLRITVCAPILAAIKIRAPIRIYSKKVRLDALPFRRRGRKLRMIRAPGRGRHICLAGEPGA